MKFIRIVAVILIVLGFSWLTLSPAFYRATSTAMWSTYIERIPQKDIFTKREVQEIIIDLGQQYSRNGPWIFKPALIMLIGFFLYLRSIKYTKNNTAEQGAAANP